jgi:hypothetical protein
MCVLTGILSVLQSVYLCYWAYCGHTVGFGKRVFVLLDILSGLENVYFPLYCYISNTFCLSNSHINDLPAVYLERDKKGKAVPLQAWSDPEGSVVKVKQSRYRPGVDQRVPGI